MEESDYNIEDAALVIHQNISQRLQEKFTIDDIEKMLYSEFDYLIEVNIITKKKPICTYPIMLDMEKMMYFIIDQCVKKDIILTYDEIEEIMEAEVIYLEQQGLTSDEGPTWYLN